MSFLYEIFPVFLFLLVFKFYDIYMATLVGMIATFAQTLLNRFWFKKWDKMQLITLGAFIFFGSLTLYFHNPIFVKWKPTIIFWIFSFIMVVTQLFTPKPLIQRLMEKTLEEKACVPAMVWKKLNMVWTAFFILLGGINLYIAYHFSNNVWVNFKFYGICGAVFILTLFQVFYLMPYMTEKGRDGT